MSDVNFECLKGKTLRSVIYDDIADIMWLETVTGERYKMYHYQDCCETVYVESVVGDLADIIGDEILVAEEVVGESTFDADSFESTTWTFYKIDTAKGGVTIRWCGSSNGYYSESVDFEEVST